MWGRGTALNAFKEEKMRSLSRNLMLSVCLMLPISAHALDISVGGENGVNASVGGNGSGGLGVDASVGGSGGVNASASVGGNGGGGLGADVNASVGGSNGVNADVNASVGGSGGINAGVNASVGGSGGLNANVGANVGGSSGVGLGVGVGVGGTTTPGTPGAPGSVNPGGVPPGVIREAIRSYNDMSRTEQIKLARRCVDILGGGYDAALTQLCKMIRTASR